MLLKKVQNIYTLWTFSKTALFTKIKLDTLEVIQKQNIQIWHNKQNYKQSTNIAFTYFGTTASTIPNYKENNNL